MSKDCKYQQDWQSKKNVHLKEKNLCHIQFVPQQTDNLICNVTFALNMMKLRISNVLVAIIIFLLNKEKKILRRL